MIFVVMKKKKTKKMNTFFNATLSFYRVTLLRTRIRDIRCFHQAQCMDTIQKNQLN